MAKSDSILYPRSIFVVLILLFCAIDSVPIRDVTVDIGHVGQGKRFVPTEELTVETVATIHMPVIVTDVLNFTYLKGEPGKVCRDSCNCRTPPPTPPIWPCSATTAYPVESSASPLQRTETINTAYLKSTGNSITDVGITSDDALTTVETTSDDLYQSTVTEFYQVTTTDDIASTIDVGNTAFETVTVDNMITEETTAGDTIRTDETINTNLKSTGNSITYVEITSDDALTPVKTTSDDLYQSNLTEFYQVATTDDIASTTDVGNTAFDMLTVDYMITEETTPGDIMGTEDMPSTYITNIDKSTISSATASGRTMSTIAPTSEELCPPIIVGSELKERMPCNDAGNTCVYKQTWCDERFDCPNGHDELFCPLTTTGTSSTEPLTNCPPVYNRSTQKWLDQVSCYDEKLTCIYKSNWCDNIYDCPNAADEVNCQDTVDDNGDSDVTGVTKHSVETEDDDVGGEQEEQQEEEEEQEDERSDQGDTDTNNTNDEEIGNGDSDDDHDTANDSDDDDDDSSSDDDSDSDSNSGMDDKESED